MRFEAPTGRKSVLGDECFKSFTLLSTISREYSTAIDRRRAIPQESTLMASGQSESSVELARLGDESRGVIRTPAASGTETSSGSTVASARPSLPFYSLSWPWARPLGILQSIKLFVSASKWRTIHSTINTAAMVLAMLSFPLVVFGAWMAWAALKASWWAQSKEEFEWCEDVSVAI